MRREDTTPWNLPSRVRYPVIAVGDVHGQLGLLDALLAQLRRHPCWADATVVFLGDFGDRGPATRTVLDRVTALARQGKATAVMGNHDLALVRAAGLDGQVPSPYWLDRYATQYDAWATLRSYLGRPSLSRGGRADFAAALRRAAAAMPAAHRGFLAALPWVVEAPGHVFVHAGLSRHLRLPAAEQLVALRERQWAAAWVRPEAAGLVKAHAEYPAWLGADRTASLDPLPLPGRVQVTGHVTVPAAEENAVRLRLDTSGGHWSPLSAAVLTGAGQPAEIVTAADRGLPRRSVRLEAWESWEATDVPDTRTETRPARPDAAASPTRTTATRAGWFAKYVSAPWWGGGAR